MRGEAGVVGIGLNLGRRRGSFPGISHDGSTELDPYFGVSVDPIVGPPHGFFVVEVEKGGPASKAGFVVGDVVVRIQKRPVGSGTDMMDLFQRSKPNDRLSFTLARKKKMIEAVMVVGAKAKENARDGEVGSGDGAGQERHVSLDDEESGFALSRFLETNDTPPMENMPMKAADKEEIMKIAREADACGGSEGEVEVAEVFQIKDSEMQAETSKMKNFLKCSLQTANGDIRGVHVIKGDDTKQNGTG